jgi:fatty acid synthase
LFFIVSGVAALAKVIVAMEDGIIPANLHYEGPLPGVPALNDGRMKVVSQHTAWAGGYVGINSCSMGGTNVHCLLKSMPKKGAMEHPASSKPRLATFAARTKEGVQNALDEMQKQSHNVSIQALLQENATPSMKTHRYRGYTILNRDTYVPEIQVQHRILSI